MTIRLIRRSVRLSLRAGIRSAYLCPFYVVTRGLRAVQKSADLLNDPVVLAGIEWLTIGRNHIRKQHTSVFLLLLP